MDKVYIKTRMQNKKGLFIIGIVAIMVILLFNVDLSPQTTISLPQCQQDSDCPIPVKNECEGFFVGCVNNQCMYNNNIDNVVICENELVTILMQQPNKPKITPIEGSKSFVFNAKYKYDSFNFGINPFETKLDFTCSIEEGSIHNYPSPSENCYKAEATFDGKTYNLQENEEVIINEHIKFRYNGGGKVYGTSSSASKSELLGQFLFAIIDPLSISISDNMEVLHNSDKTFTLNTKNNLPTGDFYIRIRNIAKQTNEILPETYINAVLEEGYDDFSLDLNTENYGIHEVEARIFYKLVVDDEEILIPLTQVSFEYNVVDVVQDIDDVVVIEEDIIEEGIPLIVKVLIGLVIILILFRL